MPEQRAHWVDLRVPREETGRAVDALVTRAFRSVEAFLVDPNPPASGPETEISARLVREIGDAERELRALLEGAGVLVLASRGRSWERR